jgi:hypothetical protein
VLSFGVSESVFLSLDLESVYYFFSRDIVLCIINEWSFLRFLHEDIPISTMAVLDCTLGLLILGWRQNFESQVLSLNIQISRCGGSREGEKFVSSFSSF